MKWQIISGISGVVVAEFRNHPDAQAFLRSTIAMGRKLQINEIGAKA